MKSKKVITKAAEKLTEADIMQIVANDPRFHTYLVRCLSKEPPFMRNPRSTKSGRRWRYKGAGPRLRELMIQKLMPSLLNHIKWEEVAALIMINNITKRHLNRYINLFSGVRLRSK